MQRYPYGILTFKCAIKTSFSGRQMSRYPSFQFHNFNNFRRNRCNLSSLNSLKHTLLFNGERFSKMQNSEEVSGVRFWTGCFDREYRHRMWFSKLQLPFKKNGFKSHFPVSITHFETDFSEGINQFENDRLEIYVLDHFKLTKELLLELYDTWYLLPNFILNSVRNNFGLITWS